MRMAGPLFACSTATPTASPQPGSESTSFSELRKPQLHPERSRLLIIAGQAIHIPILGPESDRQDLHIDPKLAPHRAVPHYRIVPRRIFQLHPQARLPHQRQVTFTTSRKRPILQSCADPIERMMWPQCRFLVPTVLLLGHSPKKTMSQKELQIRIHTQHGAAPTPLRERLLACYLQVVPSLCWDASTSNSCEESIDCPCDS